MNSEAPASAASAGPDASSSPFPGALLPTVKSSRRWLRGVALVAVAGVAGSGLLWQKLGNIQEQLARQTAESGSQAGEARATAKQAQELAIETAAKLAVLEARLSEVALQRTQLEELMQSLSRSRDENLVVDIESSLRLAQQQAQLTGSVEPLLASLKSAELRVARAAQPRLTPLQRAIAKDVARIKATVLSDTPAMLVKLDELVSLADDMPVGNAVIAPKSAPGLRRETEESLSGWSGRLLTMVREEVRGLVRVSKIENPDVALLSPEQSFFVRENFKLKVLNARLGLLSRQTEAARTDLVSASNALTRYFDANSRKAQTAQALLLQLQSQMRTLEVPRVDETLAALATAAAGR
ncbi:uroporphyrinogen-III C-methyltransferase [Rhodoferax bucti]|uniref:uroporphyrinogen-III C-methyltransferase n=1 Tax=Rhodoferax bucti TaxID=2576305 RepID=UPI001108A831|nr:uroporphyrinogen-III C-methyltransferase [Rhodoferax bucti]